MRYSLLVTGGPDSQAADSALLTARAILGRGHNLYRVFFYRQGVGLASRLNVSDGETPDINQQWQTFLGEHEIDAVVCVGAALRRGILDDSEAQRHQRSAANLATGFTLSGLGQWADALIVSDRVMQFG